MGFTIVQNQTGFVNPNNAILLTGWNISGIYATHSSCNAGYITALSSFGLVVGQTRTVTYTVDNYTSGQVVLHMGSTAGTPRTANGTYTETLLCAGTPFMSFYSDGDLRLSFVDIFDPNQPMSAGNTLSFNEAQNKWGAEYTYYPELFVKFIDSLFVFNQGQLWKNNTNPIRNNFFGQQGISQILFYANINPTTQKLYYSMRVEANKVWYCPNDGDISILPSEGRSMGMSSRLKKNNFNNYQGSFFADFLRNTLDPRFISTLDALFKGEPLRGRYVQILLTNADTVEVKLFEVDVKSSLSEFTY